MPRRTRPPGRPATPPEPQSLTNGRLFGGTPLGLLPAALREPRRPLLAILLGWAFAFLPSLLLSWASQTLLPGLAKPEFTASTPLPIFALVVFAPVVETLIMGSVLSVLLRVMPPAAGVVASAIGWGIAHSLMAPIWGLTIWWPFLIFSALFVVWRRQGWWLAAGLVASVHALHNLLPALYLATHA
jgi:hypothetical protein